MMTMNYGIYEDAMKDWGGEETMTYDEYTTLTTGTRITYHGRPMKALRKRNKDSWLTNVLGLKITKENYKEFTVMK